MYACVCVYVYISLYVCMFVCVYVCIPCMHARMYACICVCTYVWMNYYVSFGVEYSSVPVYRNQLVQTVVLGLGQFHSCF